ncbi:MAG: FHA domain-containing protein [Acidimicrobiales bacterium]
MRPPSPSASRRRAARSSRSTWAASGRGDARRHPRPEHRLGFALEHVITTAGRHPQSDIFLDDVTVSRRHAEVERTASGAVVVRDVGSLNGTYLNQQRIDGDATMAHGDELQIGKFKLVYLAGQGS